MPMLLHFAARNARKPVSSNPVSQDLAHKAMKSTLSTVPNVGSKPMPEKLSNEQKHERIYCAFTHRGIAWSFVALCAAEVFASWRGLDKPIARQEPFSAFVLYFVSRSLCPPVDEGFTMFLRAICCWRLHGCSCEGGSFFLLRRPFSILS